MHRFRNWKSARIICMLATVLLAALWFFGMASASSAEEPLTLERAIAIAMEKNRDVLSAREELKKADGLLIDARSGMLPRISLEGSGIRRNDTGTNTRRENSANMTLSQNLYAGGVIREGERQALLTKQKAEQTVRTAEESVALQVVEAYYTALLRKADLRTAQETLDYYETSYLDYRKRFELGLSTKLETARADQQRTNARADLIKAANALNTARIDLYTLLRLPPDSGRVISGELDISPASEDRNPSVSAALAQRPDLQSLRTDVAIRKTAVEIAKAGMRPTVTLSGAYQLNDTSGASATDDDEWTVTLSIKAPLYDGGQTKGKVRQEQATRAQAEQAVGKKEEAVRAEVEQARLNAASSLETAGAARKNVSLAEESLRLAEVGYREGVNTQLDVLQARTTLTEAGRALSSSLRDYRVSLAQLRKAEGTLVSTTLKR